MGRCLEVRGGGGVVCTVLRWEEGRVEKRERGAGGLSGCMCMLHTDIVSQPGSGNL